MMPDNIDNRLRQLFETNETAEVFRYDLTMEELSSKFIDYLLYDLSSSRETVTKYRNNIRWLVKTLPVESPEQITLDQITVLRKKIQDRKAGPYRINSLIFTLRKFLHYCRDRHHLITINPQEIKPMKIPKREVLFLTVEEIRQLLESFNIKDKRELRVRALMELLLATGMRISEALSINKSQIDWKKKEVSIIGKGDKQRTVYLNDRSISWLQQYFDRRKDNTDFLFATFAKKPERLARYDLAAQFRFYAKRAGITKTVTPHVLRHTMATLLLKNGCNIKFIQEMLGHSDIKTTAKYYLGTDKEATKAAHDKYLRFD